MNDAGVWSQLAFFGVLALLYYIFVRPSGGQGKGKGYSVISDKYKTLQEVQEALRKAGLESSNLIVGVDYTKSNEFQGARSFGGKCLHTIDHEGKVLNPYQEVISVIGETLEVFDDDRLIPAFGFGDCTTSDKKVFSIIPYDRPANGFSEVLEKYSEITPLIGLSGPTSFVPLIKKAIGIVSEEKAYHILLIVADGQVSNERENIRAIVEASDYPLSIVMVGVGDGPWDAMETFDDSLHKHGRKFDNFQFVSFEKLKRKYRGNPSGFSAAFALAALMEIPEQFKYLRENSMLG